MTRSPIQNGPTQICSSTSWALLKGLSCGFSIKVLHPDSSELSYLEWEKTSLWRKRWLFWKRRLNVYKKNEAQRIKNVLRVFQIFFRINTWTGWRKWSGWQKPQQRSKMWQWWGFLPGFIHTKGRSWVSSYLPSWILSLPKKTKTMRGTSTLNELWKTSENRLVYWKRERERQRGKEPTLPEDPLCVSCHWIQTSSHLFISWLCEMRDYLCEVMHNYLRLASERWRELPPKVTWLVWAGADFEQSPDSEIRPFPLPRCFLENLRKKYARSLKSVRHLNKLGKRRHFRQNSIKGWVWIGDFNYKIEMT